MPLNKDVDLDDLATRSEGYVGADIMSLCREAAMIALRHDMTANEVGMKHFEEALRTVRASVDDATRQYYDRMAQDLAGGLALRKRDYTKNIEVG